MTNGTAASLGNIVLPMVADILVLIWALPLGVCDDKIETS